MNVKPTRMELSLLKRRLHTAARGHKLLKDRRDELIRQFTPLIRRNAALRAEVERALPAALAEFALCDAAMEPAMLDAALMCPARAVDLRVGRRSGLCVDAPKFELSEGGVGGARPGYGLAETSPLLDGAIEGMAAALPLLVELAEVEQTCHLLADEIERTRRRVNALEHVLIPDLRGAIRCITLKLEEDERGAQLRLTRIKAKIKEGAHGTLGRL